MSIIVVSTPEKTINRLDSNVNAAKSQLPYEFKREDYEVFQIINIEGKAQLGLIDSDITNQFNVGDLVYYEAPSENNYKKGIYLIEAIEFSLNRTRIILNLAYTADDVGYTNNLSTRQNYKLVIQVLDKNSEILIPLTFRFAAEQNGRIFINVSQILIDYMRFISSVSQEYILQYWESWRDNEEPKFETLIIQAIIAKKQIGIQGGSNLWEHLLRIQSENSENGTITDAGSGNVRFTTTDPQNFNSLDIVEIKSYGIGIINVVNTGNYVTSIPYKEDISQAVMVGVLAQTLTKFKNPSIWKGWRRTCGYIVDKNLVNRFTVPLRSVIQIADINKTLGGTNETILQSSSIIRVGLVEIKDQGGYYVAFRMTETNSSIPVSKQLFFEVKNECKNPIMVEFLNSLGSLEQHLFSINQEVNVQASPGLSYITPHSIDQEQIKGDKNRVFSEDRQTFLLIAEGLTNNQIKALAEVKISDQVFVYLSKDGSEKIKVITRDLLESNYETRNLANNEFRLAIEFPDNYDFFESKLY